MCLVAGFFVSFEQNAYANMTIFLRLLYAIQFLWVMFVWYFIAYVIYLPVVLTLYYIFKKDDSGFFMGLFAVSADVFSALCVGKSIGYIEFMDYICDLNQQCVRIG